MKWIYFLTSLVFFSCNTSKKISSSQQHERALLWQISGNGLTTPSYLYGTIHMICKEDFVFSNALQQKVKEAKNIYLELDMDDPSMMMKMASMSIMKNTSLKQLVSKEEYTTLSAFLKDSIGIPIMMADMMKPITLMSLLYLKILPCNQKESYEMKFVEWAKAEKKNIEGLESIEEQMNVFNKIPDSLQAKMIMEMVNNMGEQRRQFAEMVQAYKKQDLRGLAQKMSESPEWKGFEDVLLVNRNKNWINKIETAMKSGTQLFAVGAGHLPGNEGVIHLLRQRGYQLTPIHSSEDPPIAIFEIRNNSSIRQFVN